MAFDPGKNLSSRIRTEISTWVYSSYSQDLNVFTFARRFTSARRRSFSKSEPCLSYFTLSFTGEVCYFTGLSPLYKNQILDLPARSRVPGNCLVHWTHPFGLFFRPNQTADTGNTCKLCFLTYHWNQPSFTLSAFSLDLFFLHLYYNSYMANVNSFFAKKYYLFIYKVYSKHLLTIEPIWGTI